MTKSSLLKPPFYRKRTRQLFLIMKLTFLWIFLLCMQVSAKVYSQEGRFSFDKKEVRLAKAFSLIERKSNYRFFYNNKQVAGDAIVVLSAEKAPISDLLDSLLSGLGLHYRILQNDVIMILPSGRNPQALRVSGIVSDSAGHPLVGVSVQIKGTNKGTATDADGRYEIEAPEDATLVFSYIGYDRKEMPIGGRTTIDVVLKASSTGLNEVVVVGYGTQKKASLTGAVTTVQGNAIEQIPTSSLSNTLAGRIPGASIVNNSGFVGASSSIMIRGKGTYGGTSTDPLYVIDGVVQDKSAFDALDPNEVESISVLKDAATASIYGARGANGVILVETKSGRVQKPIFSYSATFSSQQPTRPLQHYSATQELQYINDQAETFGNPQPVTPEIFDYFKDKSYSILDYIWRDPSSQQHDFSINGGGENITYYMLAGFNKSTGSFKNTDYGRYNFRSNVTAKINDYMKLNLNVSGNQRVVDRFYWPYDGKESQTVADFYRSTFNWSRLYPFFVDENGDPTDDVDNGLPVSVSGWNPVELVSHGGYRRITYRTLSGIGRFDLKVPFVEGLSTSFQYSYTADDRNEKNLILFNRSYKFQPASGTNPYKPGPVDPHQLNVHNLSSSYDGITEQANFDHAYQLDWFLNYDRSFGAHHITGLLVYERQKEVGNLLSGGAYDLLTTTVDQVFNASSDPTKRSFGANEYHNARASWVGRAHYEYAGKYIGEFSFRYDGSYIFPENSRWGFFPSGSAAWLISRESFFHVPLISVLKIRGSIGSLGNDNINPYQFQNNYVSGGSYVFGNDLYNGITPGITPNPFITWEKSITYNAGLDFGLFDGKLYGTFDYFYRHTYDILASRTRVVPATYGAGLSAENYAKVDVRGYEASLSYTNRLGDITYTVGANMGYAKDKVVYIDEAAGLQKWRSQIGHPQDRIFGYVSEGLIRNDQDLDAIPDGFTQFGRDPMLGVILYKDIRGEDWEENSKTNGKVDSYDQTYLSDNGIPRLNYGVSLGAAWKGLSLDALFQGVGAYDRMISTINGGGVFQTGDRPYFQIWADDHWSPTHTNAKYPRAGQWSEEFGAAPSTFWLRNGAYMRLKNLTVAYALPSSWIAPLKMQSCKVFFNGTNLFVISSIKIMDPEQSSLDSYPVMKSFTGGINITF